MQKLNIHKFGLVLGTFVGLVHLLWTLVVGFGFAESKLTFVLGMHFLSVPFTLLSFSWMGGLWLVVLSSIVGYVMGLIFSTIWNKVGVR